MKKIHKCNYKPALIVFHETNKKLFCDLASYCPECGKIGPCLDNSLRIKEEYQDGRVKRRIKTNEEILEEFTGVYPKFEIGDWEQEKI